MDIRVRKCTRVTVLKPRLGRAFSCIERVRKKEREAGAPVTGREGVRARARENGGEKGIAREKEIDGANGERERERYIEGWLGGKRTTEKITMLERDAMHVREGCSERRR